MTSIKPDPDLDALIEKRAAELAAQIGHTWTDEQLARVRALLTLDRPQQRAS